MSLRQIQAASDKTLARHLRIASAEEGIWVREVVQVVDQLSRLGAQDALQSLSRRGPTVTANAARSASDLGRRHAIIELEIIAAEAAGVAERDTRPASPVPAAYRDIWVGLVDRVGPGIAAAGDQALALLSELDQVTRIITTEWWRAYNESRTAAEVALAQAGDQSTYAVRELTDYAPAIVKRWDATLDKRTCDRCRPMSGSIALLGYPFGSSSPPLHPRCRCTIQFWPVPIPSR